ncbi:MAG: glycosyltransferase family 39 protein [Prolixibacteraceae bacterium]|nr:glycosyltransferase family 39 protein [Prolixibacteraceae bacterium]
MLKYQFNRYSWLIIPIAFLILSAPFALEYIFYFPDEKYYNDSALQMIERGDYLTPYQADGNERFLKPIVTYWTLIGSFKLLGVSKLSSRLFFWLAGALLIAITFLMVKAISKQHKTALLAAAITAANPLVLMSSGRSIPDILLTLFLTITAYGFMRIMLDEKPRKAFYFMAYLGAAMAFETKGLPAAAFTGVSILYILVNPWCRRKTGHLISPGIIMISLIVALSWFLIMYLEHGPGFLSSFFDDQMGGRLASKITLALKNITLGIINLIAFTIPWILITISSPRKLKRYIKEADNGTKAIMGFIAVWTLMIILMSGAVFKFYDRYLLPVIPLTALFFALVITNAETKFQGNFLRIFITLNIAIFSLNLFSSVFLLPDKILITGTIFTAILLFVWYGGYMKNLSTGISLSAFILLLCFNSVIMLYPFLKPNMGEQLVSALKSEDISVSDKVYVYGNIRTASNIRIQSHNIYDVISMDTIYIMPEKSKHFIVFSEKEKPFLNLDNYKVLKGSEEFQRLEPEKCPGFLQNVIKKIKTNGQVHYIAIPEIN